MESCVPTEQNKTVLTTFNAMKQENFSQKIARNRRKKKQQKQLMCVENIQCIGVSCQIGTLATKPFTKTARLINIYLTRPEPEQPDLKKKIGLQIELKNGHILIDSCKTY